METLLNFLIVAGFGWWAGSAWTAMILRSSFQKILKELGVTDQQLKKLARDHGMEAVDPKESVIDEPELTPVEIKLEQHQGVIYAYRIDDNRFLGQGADREELIESLKKNLRDVRLIITEEHGARLIKS
jgi:hypothetical protein